MKVVINILAIISGGLGALIGLFMLVGIQGARGIAEAILGISIILMLFSFALGGFVCLDLDNRGRKLLLVGSALIVLLISVYVAWTIIGKNTEQWDVVSYIMISISLFIPFCNLFVFTRPKVKEMFK